MIKLNLYNVTDTATGEKVKVHYSAGERTDGRIAVTIYEKNHGRKLGRIFKGEAVNNSDSMTDYFETSRVVLFEDHPLYPAALEAAKRWERKWEQRRAA